MSDPYCIRCGMPHSKSRVCKRDSKASMVDEMRSRIAEIIYGDGDEISWARAVQLADVIIWETRISE